MLGKKSLKQTLLEWRGDMTDKECANVLGLSLWTFRSYIRKKNPSEPNTVCLKCLMEKLNGNGK
jgi:hypothetical protein